MDQTGETTITANLAVVWATAASGSTTWRAKRLDAVRGFARYLQAIDPKTEVPPSDLLPRGDSRAVPYIYTDAEISALMDATQTLRPTLRQHTYATLIGLLAVTGMRVGEAIHLDNVDVNLEQGFLTVRNTKFGKSREVALHPTTTAALTAYKEVRDELLRRPSSPSFLVSRAGSRLVPTHVDYAYRPLVREAGLKSRSPRCRPRVHDLRHTFAVHTLLQWYREDLDVAARLPLLSTYLGHVDPASTYWYLSATPELLSLASERLHRILGESQ